MPGVTATEAATSEIAASTARSSAAEAHLGTDFHEQLNQHEERLGVLEGNASLAAEHLDGRLAGHDAQLGALSTRLNTNENTLAGTSERLNDQEARLDQQGARLDQQGARLDQQGAQVGDMSAQLSRHETRLTALQPEAPRTISDADRTVAEARLRNFHAVGGSNSFETGNATRDALLRQRIANDPLVKLHSDDLNAATQSMRSALDRGDARGLEEAGKNALASAEKLDAARKGIESTGVFQAGNVEGLKQNSFSRKAAWITGGAAITAGAAGVVTGSMIAQNNYKQGHKADS